MQSFLGDAGKGGNALKQVSQREGVDNSRFRDRYTPQAGSSSSSQSTFRQSSVPHSQEPAGIHHPPQPFNLSRLSAALADPTVGPAIRAHHQPSIPGHFERSWGSGLIASPPARSSPAPNFVGEFSQGQHAPPAQSSGWAETFNAGKGKTRAIEPMPMAHQQMELGNGYNNGFACQPSMPYQPSFTPMYGGMGGQVYQSQTMQRPLPQETSEKDMEEAFERAMADWKAMDEAHKQSQADNQSHQEPEVTDEMGQDGIEDKGEAKGELEKVWESLRPEAERLNKLAEWEKDFSQFTNDEDDLFDTLNESLNRSDVGQTPLDDQMRINESGLEATDEDLGQYIASGRRPQAYEYTLPNRFDNLDPQEAWAQANQLLNSGGSLTDATLLLETYLRRMADQDIDKQREIEAWSLLGKTHAMNEKEEKALSAFEEGRRSIQGHNFGPGLGDMLTNLAISYVNESADLEALQVLHQFLALLHPEHAGEAPTEETIQSRSNPWAAHHEVTEKYLALARDQYNAKQVVDPDVQVGLGTLYYMMGEYNDARDCWVAALGERPNDYLLWNRLGATLANGGNPEEAVDAYRRALEIKPLFTRATFNLGVACLNIGVFKEAAEHILAALSLHGRDAEKEQRDSTPMWLTLRRALIALDMLELSGQARPGADLDTFRQAGFDF